MTGAIFLELKKYVDTKYGGSTWSDLLAQAGLAEKEFSILSAYPDEEAVALVGAAVKATGKSAADILEDFGAFIAPDLLDMFWGAIQPEWRTLDVIEHTERTIHSVVRLENPGARPPELQVTRPTLDEVIIDYRSPRRMCALARGIARGLAGHFAETVAIAEAECMHRGDSRCLISVRLAR
ncbi:MAG: heme NO-binding domain-containing protein [Vicinamibacteria bacterium]